MGNEENRLELKRLAAQRREDYLQRIPIEGKFGQGKNGYRLNYIRAKRADTSAAWINSIFLVMNLLILLRVFCWLSNRAGFLVRGRLGEFVGLCVEYWRSSTLNRSDTAPGDNVVTAL